jgi:hypothetical protein
MQGSAQPMLLTMDEVMGLLRLDMHQVQWLTNTTQLQLIRICGQERYDARDVRQLIDSYRATQARKKQ